MVARLFCHMLERAASVNTHLAWPSRRSHPASPSTRTSPRRPQRQPEGSLRILGFFGLGLCFDLSPPCSGAKEGSEHLWLNHTPTARKGPLWPQKLQSGSFKVRLRDLELRYCWGLGGVENHRTCSQGTCTLSSSTYFANTDCASTVPQTRQKHSALQ